MIDLSGKRVLITGGSRGIGAACCELFARAGAAVAVHFRSRRDAADRVLRRAPDRQVRRRSLRGRSRHRLGGRRRPHVRDSLEQRWGALDCLVNNAGVWLQNPLRGLDEAVLDETLRINVKGSFLCAERAVPLLERSTDGNIVNLTSTAGQRGEAFYSSYAASKGAMISATKAWASELAPRIRVNSVAPGWVDTDMSAAALRSDAAQRQSIVDAIPLRRIATAEDIAGPTSVLGLAAGPPRHR